MENKIEEIIEYLYLNEDTLIDHVKNDLNSRCNASTEDIIKKTKERIIVALRTFLK